MFWNGFPCVRAMVKGDKRLDGFPYVGVTTKGDGHESGNRCLLYNY
jgi:hypothetical protein